MGNDYIFITAGVVSIGLAVIVLASGLRPGRRGEWLAGALWICFGIGLLVQGFAPHLRIEGRSFMLPTSAGRGLSPQQMLERDRTLQVLSLALTGGSAMGLAIRYRGALGKGGISRNADDPPDESGPMVAERAPGKT